MTRSLDAGKGGKNGKKMSSIIAVMDAQLEDLEGQIRQGSSWRRSNYVVPKS